MIPKPPSPQMQRLMARIAEIEKRQKGQSTSQLAYSAIEDGALREFDREGKLSQIIGKQFDGTHLAASVNGPTPPTPLPAALTPSAGGLLVKWRGGFIGDALVPMDFSRVEVVVSTEPTFDPGNPPLSTFETPRGGEHFIKLPPSEHYVWLVTRALTGKASTESEMRAATPLLIEEEDIADFALSVKKMRSLTHQLY